MKNEFTFENMISLIRETQGIPDKTSIGVDTYLEKDLRITGDDGEIMLREIEDYFSFRYSDNSDEFREIFKLENDQFLFHSEPNLFSPFYWLFGKKENIKPLTIGQLFEATAKAINLSKKMSEPEV